MILGQIRGERGVEEEQEEKEKETRESLVKLGHANRVNLYFV